MLVALTALVVLMGWQVRKLLQDPTIFPPDDFVEYWAAGKLNARGQNPYDPSLLHDLQKRETARQEDEAVMMWNPPWTLSFVMPFGLLPARDAQLLWLLMSLIACVASGDWLWRVHGGPARYRWVSWLLTLTFLPTVFALTAGQIPPLILLGITAFLAFQQKGWPWLAGAAGVLIAIKPHLMYLFWVALAVWGARRGWRVLAGGAVAGLVATAIPMLCNPQVLSQYREALTQRPPAQWKSPTLGSMLRESLGETAGYEAFVLQFLPVALGLGFLAWYAWRQRNREWDWTRETPLLLLASFVTASYGAWPYDALILLPAVMHVAAGIARDPTRKAVARGVLAFLAVNGPALALNVLGVTSNWFFWIGPLMLGLYLWLRPAETGSMRP
jgi:hypothetical protein